MEAVDHVEQVLRRLVLVGEDVDAQAPVAAGAMVKTPADVSGAALLATFQDQRAHAARVARCCSSAAWIACCARLKVSGRITPLLLRMKRCRAANCR